MLTKEFMQKLPGKPEAGVIVWLYNTGKFTKGYIVYKYGRRRYDPLTGLNEPYVQCKCTACEKEFEAQYVPAGGCHCAHPSAAFGFFHERLGNVISGETTYCPCCGETADAIHASYISKNGCPVETIYPITLHNTDGAAVLLQWEIKHILHKNASFTISTSQYNGYVFTDRKTIRLSGWRSGAYGSRCSTGVWNELTVKNDVTGSLDNDLIYPSDEHIFDSTPLENVHFTEYVKSGGEIYPISYLKLWKKHHNIENLITSGLGYLVNEKIRKSCASYYYKYPQLSNIQGINFKEVKPHKMLGLTKEELRTARKDKWVTEDINFYIDHRAELKPEDMKECSDYDIYGCKMIAGAGGKIMRSIRYLKKQRKKHKNNVGSTDLTDYWKMARANGRDMTDEDVVYPQNLKRAHDIEAQQYEAETSTRQKKQFKERFRELSKFSFEYEGLTIHPARTPNEMRTEGKKLHHCVGSYVKNHAEGETTIFFIRKADKPKTPYYTLEFDFETMKIRQNRGDGNCDRTDEVLVFEVKWIEFVKEMLKNEAKKRKAA